MTPDLETLGRRAIVCEGWRWMAGMLDNFGDRTVELLDSHVRYYDSDGQQLVVGALALDQIIPDFSDPATLGCLRALVREATGDPVLNTEYVRDRRWVTRSMPGGIHSGGETEAGALVAALEAAGGAP